MFSGIRKHLTYTNVVVTLALVFAMSGGAYAASRYVLTSTKQISPKVLKALQGKAGAGGAQGVAGPAGATGPVGAQGPAGGSGEKGEKGDPGAPGTPGTSVTAKGIAPGGECEAGGVKLTPGGKVCNGSPWTAGGTLPKGRTESGAYASAMIENAFHVVEGRAAISFVIPLPSAPGVVYIPPGGIPTGTGTGDLTSGSNVVTNVTTLTGELAAYAAISGQGIPAGTKIKKVVSSTELELSGPVTETGTGVSLSAGPPAGCAGSVEAPQAAEGLLCVYAKSSGFGSEFTEPEAYAAGALLNFQHGFAGFFATGSWAVTSAG